MKAIVVFLLLVIPLSAKPLYWKRLASGYKDPVDLKPIAGGQYLLVEKPGRIFLTNLKGSSGVILDWTQRIKSNGREQGFLSIALSPDFNSSGKAYFNIINKKGNTEIWRYTFNPRKLSESRKPAELLLTFDQPYGNHNGGWMDFGPDGMLYIATGDGGSANDPKNLAQDLNSLLGKILRINVSGSSGYSIPKDNPFIGNGKAEIYAYGLRNPWRCYWHGSNLIVADVGQNKLEEINYVSKSKLRGANFGWRLREGNIATPKKDIGGNKPTNNIEPCLTYPHEMQNSLAGISVTGGVIYNGSVRELKGKYIFADFGVPRVWAAKLSPSSYSNLMTFGESVLPDSGKVNNIASFARDKDGEVFMICLHGDIFKLAQ